MVLEINATWINANFVEKEIDAKERVSFQNEEN